MVKIQILQIACQYLIPEKLQNMLEKDKCAIYLWTFFNQKYKEHFSKAAQSKGFGESADGIFTLTISFR